MPHRGKYLFLLPYEQWVTFGPNQLPGPAHPQRGDRDGAGVGHPLMPEASVGCICPSHLGSVSPICFWELNTPAWGMTPKRCVLEKGVPLVMWVNDQYLLNLHPIISHWKADREEKGLIILACFKHKGKNNIFEISGGQCVISSALTSVRFTI